MKRLIAKIIAPWDIAAEWAHEYGPVPWSELGWRVWSAGSKVLLKLTRGDTYEYLRLIDDAWDKQKLKIKKGR